MGRLEVICGPMFSGKTELLIQRVNQMRQNGVPVQVFKHALDTRFDQQAIVSHAGESINALAVSSACDFIAAIDRTAACICIDEIQFFDDTMYDACKALVLAGTIIIVAGLDLDFRAQPFGCMPLFLSYADYVIKQSASCCSCGLPARFTQRISKGRPACCYEPLIVVASSELYEARCWNCFEGCETDCCKKGFL